MLHEYLRIICTHCGDVHEVPVYCGDRFCPICSQSRRAKVRNRLSWLTAQVQPNTAFSYYHLTLTIRSEPNLSAMIKRISSAFRRLRQRIYWKKHVKGGAFVVEITKNGAGFHAHIHAVIYSRWLSWEKLVEIWKKVSTGQGVYIQRIPPRAAVGYLTKYLTKPEAPENDCETISESLKGIRLWSPFGTWFAINKKYVPPKPPCPKCQHTSFLPEDIFYGRFPKPIYKNKDGTVASAVV